VAGCEYNDPSVPAELAIQDRSMQSVIARSTASSKSDCEFLPCTGFPIRSICHVVVVTGEVLLPAVESDDLSQGDRSGTLILRAVEALAPSHRMSLFGMLGFGSNVSARYRNVSYGVDVFAGSRFLSWYVEMRARVDSAP
jgi:hypothetical protein